MWTFKNGVSKIHVEISSMVYGVMEEEGLVLTFPDGRRLCVNASDFQKKVKHCSSMEGMFYDAVTKVFVNFRYVAYVDRRENKATFYFKSGNFLNAELSDTGIELLDEMALIF